MGQTNQLFTSETRLIVPSILIWCHACFGLTGHVKNYHCLPWRITFMFSRYVNSIKTFGSDP